MTNLRQRLSEIADNGLPHTHASLLSDLNQEFPHSIELVTSITPINSYTCVMYALDFVDDPIYTQITLNLPAYKNIFASTVFLNRLILRGHLQKQGTPNEGLIIVYSDAGKIKHVGRLLSDTRAQSKWGTGHLYRHALLETPKQYGSELSFFTPIDHDLALDQYVEYARENCLRLDNDA